MIPAVKASVEIIFLLILISYYLLLLFPKKSPQLKRLPAVSVIIPARNEEKYILACIQSCEKNIKKLKDSEIIVVNDASSDATAKLVQQTNAILINNKIQLGKAQSINKAIGVCKNNFVAIVDGDSLLESKAIEHALPYFADNKVGAVTSAVKVKNKFTLLGMFMHLEQLYNSLLRSLFVRINANIVTPGPLSIYRKKLIQSLGGFSKKGLSEDVDIAIRILRSGNKIAMSDKSIAQTNMPFTIKGVITQRTRFIRGWQQIFRMHLQKGLNIVDLYSLPLALFWYLQAIIMSVIIIYSFSQGYYTYFWQKGTYVSDLVIRYILEWFTIAGIIRWIGSIIQSPHLTMFDTISLLTTLLSYPLYFISILKYDRSISWYHIIPLCLMFPYWFMIMIIHIAQLPQIIKPIPKNMWEKVN